MEVVQSIGAPLDAGFRDLRLQEVEKRSCMYSFITKSLWKEGIRDGKMSMCVCVCVCVLVIFSNRKHESDKKNTVDVAIESLKFLLLFEKRYPGRSSYKWEDTTQVGLEEMKCEDVKCVKNV
jgi:hypothetical protein